MGDIRNTLGPRRGRHHRCGFLLAPVTAIFAGLFLDEVAKHIEQHDYPEDTPGKEMELVPSIFLAIKFAIVYCWQT